MAALAAVPVPDDFETRTNATFEALMWALARPGSIQNLPASDPVGIVEALLDRECQVFCDDPVLQAKIVSCGAALAPVVMADHCFMSLQNTEGLAQLAQVAVGSELHPDAGATVVVSADFGTGRRLRLTGPGIEAPVEVVVGGLAEGVWSVRAARCRYPSGFDLFLLCGTRVMGLPRSTQIEVL